MDNLKTLKPEMSLWKKIRTKIRYGLTLQSIRSILMRFGIEISPFYIFKEEVRFSEMPEFKGTLSEYTIGEMGPEDIKLIGTIYEALPEKKLLELLESGEKCIGMKHKDEIAAFMWINFNVLSYGGTVMHLKSNEAYMWFGYTMESYRGHNLAPYLRYKVYEYLKLMNRDIIYSVSDCFNSPAVRFKQKLNAKKLSIILYINLFKKIRKSYTLKTYQN